MTEAITIRFVKNARALIVSSDLVPIIEGRRETPPDKFLISLSGSMPCMPDANVRKMSGARANLLHTIRHLSFRDGGTQCETHSW